MSTLRVFVLVLATAFAISTSAQAGWWGDQKDKVIETAEKNLEKLKKAAEKAKGEAKKKLDEEYKKGKEALDKKWCEYQDKENHGWCTYKRNLFGSSPLQVKVWGLTWNSAIGTISLVAFFIWLTWLVLKNKPWPLICAIGFALGRICVFLLDWRSPSTLNYTPLILVFILLCNWKWCRNLWNARKGKWDAIKDFLFRDVIWEPEPVPVIPGAGGGGGVIPAGGAGGGAAVTPPVVPPPTAATPCPNCGEVKYLNGFCYSCGYRPDRTKGGYVTFTVD